MKVIGKIWFSLVLLALCACRTVPVNVAGADVSVHADFVGHVVRDSVFVHDSIYVREKTDTVFFTRYRTLYKENHVRDTVLQCDTLYRERVVTRYTTAPGHVSIEWRWLLVLIGVLLLLIVPKIIKFIIRCIGFFHSRV
jgi:hypothetical protein